MADDDAICSRVTLRHGAGRNGGAGAGEHRIQRRKRRQTRKKVALEVQFFGNAFLNKGCALHGGGEIRMVMDAPAQCLRRAG